MIISIILLLHFLFLVFVFLKKKKSDTLASALYSAVFVIIVFSVVWTLFNFVFGFVIPPEGFGKEFDRNTISLIFVTAADALFFRYYFKELFSSSGKK